MVLCSSAFSHYRVSIEVQRSTLVPILQYICKCASYDCARIIEIRAGQHLRTGGGVIVQHDPVMFA